jgi:predicted ArsR family transcriptional regulator
VAGSLTRPVGRPHGPLAASILAAVSARQATAAELAAQLAQPVDDVVRQLSRLVAAGHVEVAALVARPPAKRPVAVYAPASGRTRPALNRGPWACATAWWHQHPLPGPDRAA